MLKHKCRTCGRTFYCVTHPEEIDEPLICKKKTEEEQCLTYCNCSECVGRSNSDCKSIYTPTKPTRNAKFIGGTQVMQ